jgi:hypothetical protein
MTLKTTEDSVSRANGARIERKNHIGRPVENKDRPTPYVTPMLRYRQPRPVGAEPTLVDRGPLLNALDHGFRDSVRKEGFWL